MQWANGTVPYPEAVPHRVRNPSDAGNLTVAQHEEPHVRGEPRSDERVHAGHVGEHTRRKKRSLALACLSLLIFMLPTFEHPHQRKQWKRAQGHLALIYVLGKKFPANEIINI